MSYIRCGNGNSQTKVLLPNNPVINVSTSSKNATITWTKPTNNDVEISKFNIYTSTTNPTDVKQMTLVASVSSSTLTYTLNSLQETTYYFLVTSVGINGYENASLKNVVSAVISSSTAPSLNGGAALIMLDKSGGYYFKTKDFKNFEMYSYPANQVVYNEGAEQFLVTGDGYGSEILNKSLSTVKSNITNPNYGSEPYILNGLTKLTGELSNTKSSPFGGTACGPWNCDLYCVDSSMDKWQSLERGAASYNADQSVYFLGKLIPISYYGYYIKKSNNYVEVRFNDGSYKYNFRCCEIDPDESAIIFEKEDNSLVAYRLSLDNHPDGPFHTKISCPGTGPVIGMCASNNGIVVALTASGSIVSTDRGKSYTLVSSTRFASCNNICFSKSSNYFFTCDGTGMYFCEANSSKLLSDSWEFMPWPSNLKSNQFNYTLGSNPVIVVS